MRANFEVGGRGCENDGGARMLTNELKDMILKMGVFRSLHGTLRRPSFLEKASSAKTTMLTMVTTKPEEATKTQTNAVTEFQKECSRMNLKVTQT